MAEPTRLRKVMNTVMRLILNGVLRAFTRLTKRRAVDVNQLRNLSSNLSQRLGQPLRHSTVRTVDLDDFDGQWFDVDDADGDTVMLYLHGGAFITETPEIHGGFIDLLAHEARVNALMPSYRLAPEHRFPAAYDDAFVSYQWLLHNGFEPSRIVVAGDSAGGNLALGLVQRLADECLPPPSCAVALSPVTDATFASASIQRNRKYDAMFTPEGLEGLAPHYIPPTTDRADPRISVLNGRMDELPPILLIVGSTELLLDDSTRFANRCHTAEIDVWHGMPHVFPLLSFLPQAKHARHRITTYIRHHLNQPSPLVPADHITH